MKCEQVTPYLPGFAGGELRAGTAALVAEHVDGCARCSAETARQRRVVSGLAAIRVADVEPPAFLLDAIIEGVNEHRARRLLPLMPVALAGIAETVSEHREAITQAAGTALVAAGAAYAVWRTMRRTRAAEPAT